MSTFCFSNANGTRNTILAAYAHNILQLFYTLERRNASVSFMALLEQIVVLLSSRNVARESRSDPALSVSMTSSSSGVQ